MAKRVSLASSCSNKCCNQILTKYKQNHANNFSLFDLSLSSAIKNYTWSVYIPHTIHRLHCCCIVCVCVFSSSFCLSVTKQIDKYGYYVSIICVYLRESRAQFSSQPDLFLVELAWLIIGVCVYENKKNAFLEIHVRQNSRCVRNWFDFELFHHIFSTELVPISDLLGFCISFSLSLYIGAGLGTWNRISTKSRDQLNKRSKSS